MRRSAFILLLSGCFQVSLEFNCHDSSECVLDNRSGGSCRLGKCVFDGDDLAGARDQSISQNDLAGAPQPDLAGADLAGGGSTCPLPQLLVTVENLGAGQPPGKIVRLHLPASGPPESCPALSGSGLLGQFPEAAAKVGDQIAVGARDGVFLIDPASDTITASWTNDPQALFPLDVAPLDTTEGTEIAVAWAQTGDPNQFMFQLDLFLPTTTLGHQHSWIASASGIGYTRSMTIDPFDAKKLMLFDDYESAAPQAEEWLDPFAPSVVSRFAEPGSANFQSLAAIAGGGGGRTAFSSPIGFSILKEPSISPAPSALAFGPVQCGTCNVLHAVPDPNDAESAFVLCDAATANERQIYHATHVSAQSMGACTLIFDGTSLDPDDRLTRLAIAMP